MLRPRLADNAKDKELYERLQRKLARLAFGKEGWGGAVQYDSGFELGWVRECWCHGQKKMETGRGRQA